MARVRIVTDSVADIPPAIQAELAITVVPAYVRFGTEVFRDAVEITREAILRRMVSTGQIPRTSQPSPHDFVDTYRRVGAGGVPIISIHVGSRLSGTYQSACLARQMVPDHDVDVVDTASGSMGEGLAVIKAAKAALAGLPKPEILRMVHDLIRHIWVFISVDTLEWLQRNGRVGRAQALLGSVLSIKPILTLEDGALTVFDRVRGAERVIPRLVEICREKVVDPARVRCVVAHTNVLNRALKLKEELEKRLGIKDVIIADAGPAIIANIGPGGLGLIFHDDPPAPAASPP